VEFGPLYDGWFGADRYQPDYARAGIEHAITFAVELGVYWFDPSQNFVDWQFPNLGSKLTTREGFRFDDNLLQTNYLFHSFAGSTHYVISRANGFGIPAALASASVSSAIYELLLEWKEIVSFNDLVVTPFGGMALGEFGYQLGEYLNSEPSPPARAAGLGSLTRGGARDLLGMPRRLHDALDAPALPPGIAADNLGFSSAYAHRFRIAGGQELVEDGGPRVARLFTLSGDFELAAMPGFLREGRFERFYTNGNFTSLHARLGYGTGTRDVDIRVNSHLFGWFAQDIDSRGQGFARETGFLTGLRFVSQQFLGREDQFGIVHLFAPVQRLWWRAGPAMISLGADVAPDFASLHSQAYESFAERYGREGTKSSLIRHGYFHGWGVSAGGSASISLGSFQLGVNGRYGHYESIDGAERMQEEVYREPHATERVGEVGGLLTIEPPRSLFSARVEVARTDRASRMGEFDAFRRSTRWEASLGARF
jgi:hypothetical protein